MASCQNLINAHASQVITNSGFYLMQYGQYYDCLQMSPKFTYNLVSLIFRQKNIQAIVYQGLCLPSQCTQIQIKQFLNEAYMNVSIDAKISHIQKYINFGNGYAFDWAFYLAILIIALLLFFVIYSTIIKALNKQTIFNMFSLQQTKKYFQANRNSSLNVFNGVKSLSMMWIVLTHHFSIGLSYIANKLDRYKIIQQEPIYVFVYSVIFAVTVFFYLAGFLVAYTTLKQVWKTNWQCLINILNRITRIWPSYLFVIMFFFAIYLHLGEGPIWGADIHQVNNCKSFYKVIFFFDVWINDAHNLCYGLSWYLDNDIQIFVIIMLLLIITKNNKRATKILLLVLFSVNIIFLLIGLQLTESQIWPTPYNNENMGVYFAFFYQKPIGWIPTYCFGLYIGYQYLQYQVELKIKSNKSHLNHISEVCFFFKIKQKIKNRYYRIVLQTLGIIIMVFLVVISFTLQHGYNWPQICYTLYLTLGPILFCFGLTLTILPSLLGFSDSFVMFCMDTTLFYYIGKISYCTYLVHMIIVKIVQINLTYTEHLKFVPRITTFVAILVISMTSGLIVTILVQAPFGICHKKLINYIKNKFQNKQQVNKIQNEESQQKLDNNKMQSSMDQKK